MTKELVLSATDTVIECDHPTMISNKISATINKEAAQMIVKALEILEANVGMSMMRIAFPNEQVIGRDGESQYGKHRIKLSITPEIKNIVTTYIDVHLIGALYLGFQTTENGEDFVTYTASLKWSEDNLYYVANH